MPELRAPRLWRAVVSWPSASLPGSAACAACGLTPACAARCQAVEGQPQMPAPASAMAGAPVRAPASNGAPKEDRPAPGVAGSSAAVRRTPRTPITPAEAGQQRPDLSSGSTTSTLGDEAGEREARSRTRGGAWQRGGQRLLTCHRASQLCCGRRCCAVRWAEQACACQAPTSAAEPAAYMMG